jgi:hypothetical protein
MPMTYLIHPLHGTKIATHDAEVEADKQNGWRLRDESMLPEPEEQPPVEPLMFHVKQRGRPRKHPEV